MPIRTGPSTIPPPRPAAPPTGSPGLATGDPWRERVRRWLMAAVVGAAVIVTPGGPTPGRGPGWRPPAYERALRWRDIIRLRLSPWLLSGVFGPPPDLTRPPGVPPEVRREPPPGESRLP